MICVPLGSCHFITVISANTPKIIPEIAPIFFPLSVFKRTAGMAKMPETTKYSDPSAMTNPLSDGCKPNIRSAIITQMKISASMNVGTTAAAAICQLLIPLVFMYLP